MIRVLLADDHAFVRRGVRETLVDAGIEVVAEAEDGDEALRHARALGDALDVAVVDLSMPGTGGLEVVSRLHAERPGLPVLVLSMHPAGGAGVQAMEAGAMGYLTKRDAPDRIVEAVRRVVSGRRYVAGAIAEALAERALGGPSGAALSVRELQVVRALASGRTRDEAAADLSVSSSTVSTYRRRALAKLDLRTDADLARYARDRGLIE